jgi:hypothetical protein
MSFFGGMGGGFPFGNMGGHHFDEEGTFAPYAEEQQEVDNNKYYETLELTKTATLEDIKKQYKELAKKYHPDRKGGDATKVPPPSFSSGKSPKHMRHCQIQKNAEYTTSSAPRDLKETTAVLPY